MQRGYTKLFNTIITSTVWQENDKTRIIWITMLALADQNGGVHASIPGLAMVARVNVEATRQALENLKAPDPDSRTKEYDGRRIEEIDGGWRILNYAKYCAMMNQAERKEYKARWMREKRRASGHDVDTSGRMRTDEDANGRGGHTETQTQTQTSSATSQGQTPGKSSFAPARPKAEPKPPAAKPPKIGWTAADGFSNIADKQLDQWRDAYPACNISLQLKRMHNWLEANPTKAKKSNWLRFIVNWLKSEQDRGGDQRQDKRKQGARVLSPHETPEFDAQYERDQEALRRAKAEGQL